MEWYWWVLIGILILGIPGAVRDLYRDAKNDAVYESIADLEDEDAPPPTDAQLNYIDILLDEREAGDLESIDPVNIRQASELITALKECPYRDE
ncbi:MAG: hypothetical protein OXC42_07305 [Gammaproteobacteria bacterium]|nr:hypothetical protein [Gammaproteobacteria bacterium]